VATMIKLKLPPSMADMASVQSLPGLADLPLDRRFGLVSINPRESLYAVRTEAVDNLDRRRELTPEILGAYGDVRVSSTKGRTNPMS
jgi:hypothetical protein